MKIGSPDTTGKVPDYNISECWVDKIGDNKYKLRIKTKDDLTSTVSSIDLTQIDLMKISYTINKYIKTHE